MEKKKVSPLHAFKDTQSGKWGFKNEEGDIVVSPKWWLAYHEFSEGMCPVVNDDKKVGFVNETGELVIPCKYACSLDFREGLCRVQDAETLMNGYINKIGETVIPFIYRKAGDFKNGLAIVRDNSGYYGAINQKNEVVYPFKYDWEDLYDMLYHTSTV